MRNITGFVLLSGFLIVSQVCSAALPAADAPAPNIRALRERFVDPPKNAGTTTLWWLNGKLSKEEIRKQLLNLRDRDGFSGVAPLTMFRKGTATEPAYLADEYFEMYGCILDTAKELGMTVVFYDDCDFPSGTAGRQMAELYPNDLMKYLARSIATVQGPAEAAVKAPPGKVMSVVAKNLDTGERRVVSAEVKIESASPAESKRKDASSIIRWPAPAGRWEVQAFVCAIAPGNRGFVDYLDPQAMKKFMSLTYDRFAQKFPEHFGATVRMTFYDDLSTCYVPDRLLWTPAFNEKFCAKFGCSPEALYPALWEDIGTNTAAARANLYGFRNELLAEGYQRAVQEWCDKRNMVCSGHPADSYRANPLQSPGDTILWYKYQGAPLTDYINCLDNGIEGYKIPASAAYNYDRPVVVCEIYGNFHPEIQQMPNDSNMLYRAGMEVYARGINCLLPHGTWWDTSKVRIQPEISWRNPDIGPGLPDYNRWAARCETLLRAGRHTADIGVLYPIDDLAARCQVDSMPFTHGADPVPGTDYYELSRLLTGELRRDFTFLHPETVDERCRVEGCEFVLANTNNWERYRVLILPACRTIRVGNLQKARDFLAAGGKVIATTCLPEQSVEFGRDAEIRKLANEMFGPGGKGIFVPKPDEKTLLQALDGLGFAPDVRLTNATEIPRTYRLSLWRWEKDMKNNPDTYQLGNRAFAYLHRSVPDAEVYFFSNASDLEVSSDVQLRGRLRLEYWDPHTGNIQDIEASVATDNGKAVTRFRLTLPPVRSIFVVGYKTL